MIMYASYKPLKLSFTGEGEKDKRQKTHNCVQVLKTLGNKGWKVILAESCIAMERRGRSPQVGASNKSNRYTIDRSVGGPRSTRRAH